MAYYLQTDGVDDAVYFSGTSFTFDEISIDCEVTGRAAFDKYLATSHTGFFQRNGSSQDQWSGNWSAAYVDGVLGTNNTAFVPMNQRITIRVTGTATANTQVLVFANNTTGAGSLAGKIYRVTVKNAGSTVLSWDMTLGHVLDQSGNGRNGTVVGATFVDDGGGAVVIEKSAAIVATASTNATKSKVMVKAAAITAAASLTGIANKVRVLTATIAPSAIVTATGRKVFTKAAAIVARAVVTATADSITIIQKSANIGATAAVTAAKVRKVIGTAAIVATVSVTAAGNKRINKTAAIVAAAKVEVNENAPLFADVTIYGGRLLKATVNGGRKLRTEIQGGV